MSSIVPCALGQNGVQQASRIGNERPHLLGRGGVLLEHLSRVQGVRPGAEESPRDRVLLGAGSLDVRLQQLRAQQVHHPQAAARHLVLVGRPDPLARGSDLLPPRRAFGRQFDHAVVRQDNLRPIGDKECAVHLYAQRPQLGHLSQKGDRVENHTVADDSLAPPAQHSARNQLQHELLPAGDHRVSGVMPAGVPRHGRKPLAQHVHNLPFAFVAPLGAQHHCRLCSHLVPFPSLPASPRGVAWPSDPAAKANLARFAKQWRRPPRPTPPSMINPDRFSDDGAGIQPQGDRTKVRSREQGVSGHGFSRAANRPSLKFSPSCNCPVRAGL
jgi:hypothetical protein